MKWTELLDAVGEEAMFETGLLLAGAVDPDDVRRQLSRWTATGRLTQLRRGLYAFAGSEAKGRPEPEAFAVANRLVRASYVSLESALAHHGLIPESVFEVTSVTTGRPAQLETVLGTFSYRHVKTAMLWGYVLEPSAGRAGMGWGGALVATPAKALVDHLYFAREADDPDYLDGLRLQNLDLLDPGELRRTADRCGSNKVVRAVQRIAGRIERRDGRSEEGATR